MEFQGFFGGLYRICEWIMRLSVVNSLWFICSIPFFFFVLIFVMTPITDGMDVYAFVVQSLVIAAVISPFTLIPASAAAFSVVRKWITGNTDVPLIKTFFKGYKENYRQSMLGGLLFVLIAIATFVSYRFYGSMGNIFQLLSYSFLVFLVILAGALFNFLSIIVHFHIKLLQALKNSLLLTIGNPLSTITIILANGLVLYISGMYTVLFIFFTGSLIAVISFWFFYRSYVRLQEKNAREKDDESDAAAEENNEDAHALPDDPAGAK